jgi:hypothetical protein
MLVIACSESNNQKGENYIIVLLFTAQMRQNEKKKNIIDILVRFFLACILRQNN